MDSISIEITERCPAGLEILRNQSSFSINLKPKGGVGDFEILNANQEVILIGQKHLSTISLLENTSRSEVLTIDLSNLSEISISCPPTEEIASIRNARMGLFQTNTLEIHPREDGRTNPLDFTWQKSSQSTSSSTQGKEDQSQPHNFQVVNHLSTVVAEVSLKRLASRVKVRLPHDLSLTPVQIAVIFAGLAFQIHCMRKQKSLLALLTGGAVITLAIVLLILYLFV